MKKRMKRALSLLLAATLSLTLLAPSAFAEGGAAESGITVYLSLFDAGVYAKDKDNKTMMQRAVKVTDRNNDGNFSLDEALLAAHETYAANGAADYAISSENSFVTKLWGKETGATGFYKNDTITGTVTEEVLDNGDNVTAFIYHDATSWSDRYSFFDQADLTVKVGEEFELTLRYAGYDGSWNPVSLPVIGAPLGVFDAETGAYSVPSCMKGEVVYQEIRKPASTDTQGLAKVYISEAGTYLLTAQHDSSNYGTYSETGGYIDNYLVPPLCKVTVLSADDYEQYEQAQKYLDAAKAQLTWSAIKGSNTYSYAVTTAPNLPDKLTVDGKEVSVSWACDDTTGALSVSAWGAYVDRPAKDDVSCTLTATLTYNEATATKTFPVTVKAEGVAEDKMGVINFGALLEGIAAGYTTSNDPWAVLDMKAYNGSNVKDTYDLYASVLGTQLANAATGETVDKTVLDGVTAYQGYEMSTYPYLSLAYEAANLDGEGDHSRASLKTAMVNYLNGGSYYSVDEMAAVIAALSTAYLANDADVVAAVNGALNWLSGQQNTDGTFSVGTTPNSNTTAMAVIALSALGVDAHTDSRFVKNYKSAVEGLLTFALSDNSGFGYKGNVTKNALATEQSFRALVSYARFRETGGAYNIYLQAKDSTSAVSAPNISATVKPSNNGSSTGQITVSASVTALGETWASGSYSVKDGTSVSTVLKKLFAANGITCVGMDRGYISSVTRGDVTLAEKDHGNNSGWMYRVNGVLPNETVNDYALHDGDEISFFYVTDYTKVDTPSAPAEDADAAVVETNADGSFTVTLPKGSAGAAIVALPGAREGQVPFIVGSDGTRRAVRRSAMIGGTLYVVLDESCTVELMDNDAAFADVKNDAWYAEAVAFVAGRGLYTGTGAQTFEPYAPMSRAMLAVVLYRLENEPAAAADALKNFVDGAAIASWAEDGLSWAVAQNVMAGSGGALFADDTITREQLIVMLWRYATLCGMDTEADDMEALAEQGVSDWAADAMAWAVQNRLLLGDESGALHPQSEASRAEVAVILMRFVALMVQ